MALSRKRGNAHGLLVPPLPKEKTKIHLHAEELKLSDSFPPCKIKKVTTSSTYTLTYPDNDDDGDIDDRVYSHADGIVRSLYPYIQARASRDGDPICDSFRVHVYDNATVWCIADGCNWGERPRQASNR